MLKLGRLVCENVELLLRQRCRVNAAVEEFTFGLVTPSCRLARGQIEHGIVHSIGSCFAGSLRPRFGRPCLLWLRGLAVGRRVLARLSSPLGALGCLLAIGSLTLLLLVFRDSTAASSCLGLWRHRFVDLCKLCYSLVDGSVLKFDGDSVAVLDEGNGDRSTTVESRTRCIDGQL